MPATHIAPKPWTGRNDPEDGDLARRLHHIAGHKGDSALLGFACEAGVARNKGRVGAKQGPTTIRKAMSNLAAPDDAKGFGDLGDIDVTGNDLEAGHETLSQHIDDALGTYKRLVVLGGGHETAYGSYLGLSRHYADQRIGIINLDAHLDLRNIGEAGPSSGTPFNQIRELNPDRFDYLCLGVAAESNTQSLIQRAKDWQVGIVTDHELIADQRAANDKIAKLIDRNDIIYLTIDIDLMPQFEAPGVSAPAARGVPFKKVEYLVNYILQTCGKAKCPLPLADIVELSPPHDHDGITAKRAAYLARRLLF